jgi:hypothetical protein
MMFDLPSGTTFSPTPSSFVFHGPAGRLVTLHADGRVELGEGATVDEAAEAFWRGVEVHSLSIRNAALEAAADRAEAFDQNAADAIRAMKHG